MISRQTEERSVAARPFQVLVVEDDLVQFTLTRLAIEKSGRSVTLHHVEDGQRCLDFLRNAGAHADAPRPDLVLMDLNMPVMDGREALTAISQDERLRSMPVIILTTSATDDDISAMYNLGCSGYLTKPVDQREYQRAMELTLDYWCGVVTLPR